MSIRKIGKIRIRRPVEEARENILAAAEKLLVEQGPLALKLTEVAAAAKVANASVLHHFGSIDTLHTALMERMVQQLIADLLAISDRVGDEEGQRDAVVRALFDVFETRGAARLAAWLELTGEWKRLTHVREAVASVVTKRAGFGDVTPAEAQDLVLVSVLVAMGAGLFGRSLAHLVGQAPAHTRSLAAELLRAHVVKRMDS
ncbi:MAG: TetR family transcriptional regulator [Proteobacteria bacterium]|nr:TetR family transcriptional regulator [Pseudomonadota bacterium]